jgi:hypothetical protein
MARKEEVVEHGISKLKIRAFLRKRSGKVYKLKSDQKNEHVVPNRDSSEASTLDTSFPSDSNSVGNSSCGIELSYEDFVADEWQAKALKSEIVAQTVTDESLLSTESLIELVEFSGIFDDEERSARRDRHIKGVLETRIHPMRGANEIVSANPTGASNPTNDVENIENVANKILDRQVTCSDSMSTLSEGEPVQESFGIQGRESKDDNFFPDLNRFCHKLEFMGRLTCDFVGILFDISDIESSRSLGRKAASARGNYGNLDKNSSLLRGSLDEKVRFASGSLDENGWNDSGGLIANAGLLNENGNGNDDNSSFNETNIRNDKASLNEKVTTTIDVHLLRDMADTERQLCDLAELEVIAAKRKVGLWKPRNKENKNEAEKQSGETSLKKLSSATEIAIDMMIVEKDVNEESQTGATSLKKSRSFERFDAVAEPLKGQQRNANSTSTILESGMIRVLENSVVLPKDDGASYQSSLDYSYPDWESALSQMEEGGMIVDLFPDDEVSLCNENTPVFVEGLEDGIASSKGSKSGADLKEADSADRKALPLNITVAKEKQDLEDSGSLVKSPDNGPAISDQTRSGISGGSKCTEHVSQTNYKIAATVAEEEGRNSVAKVVVDDTTRTVGVSKRSIVKLIILSLRCKKLKKPAVLKTEKPTMAESRTPPNTDEDKEEAVGYEGHIEKNETTRTEESVVKRCIATFKRLPLRRNKSRELTMLKTEKPMAESRKSPSAVEVMVAAGGSVGQTNKKADDWRPIVDPNTGKTYYIHRYTRKTTWEIPAGFVEVARADPKVFEAAKNPGASPYRARSNVTGGSTSTENATQSKSPKLGQPLEVAVDSIKILETTPVWKTAVDPNTGRSYYYDRLTRDTTWTPPPVFVNQ